MRLSGKKFIYYFSNIFLFFDCFTNFSCRLNFHPRHRLAALQKPLKCKNISKWCFVAVHHHRRWHLLLLMTVVWDFGYGLKNRSLRYIRSRTAVERAKKNCGRKKKRNNNKNREINNLELRFLLNLQFIKKRFQI